MLNGRLPDSALAQVPGTERFVAVNLLGQVIALRAAFEAHFGKPLVLTETYRDYATQVRYRNNYLTGRGNYAVKPGTSNHGWGTAIDFGSGVADARSAEHAWMVQNAPRFGFTWLTVAGNGSVEPWHFDGAVVPASNYITVPRPPVVVPNLPPLTDLTALPEDDMVNDIIELYTRILGRGPSTDDILDRLVQTPTQVANDLLNASPTNEPGSVDAAYRDYLNRAPDPEGRRSWGALATVRAVRAGLKNAAAHGAQ